MNLSTEQKKQAIFGGIALVVALGAYWYFGIRPYETTDNAYLKANSTLLSSKVMGYVNEVLVNDNQHVEAGDIIAVVDPRDYQARLQQAEGEVAALKAAVKRLDMQRKVQLTSIQQAEANLKAAEANHDRAKADYERASQLVESGAISRKDYDAAMAQHKGMEASLKSARAALDAAHAQLNAVDAQIEETAAQLKVAEAALRLAEIDLEHTRIVAPKAGVVGNKAVHVGQLVRPGTVLAYFVPDNEVWVEANFKETQVKAMQSGQPVTIEVDAYPGEKLKGTLESLAPASGAEFSILPPENATGNFTKIVRRIPVKIVFIKDQKKPILRPGMSSYVKVKTK